MAKIFYSMAGEGRGHAVRVRTLVEHLRQQHELFLFAPDDAFEFLARCYGPGSAHPEVRLLRIPGLRFHYTNGRLDLIRSIAGGLTYATVTLRRLVAAFRRRIESERPDLVLCDFEPSLPRAAARAGVPMIAIDHQHVLLAYDLSSLPRALQRHAWSMSWAVRWHYGWGPQTVVTSSFYTPPLKPGWESVHQVGPMIRPEVAAMQPQTGDYLLSYLRASTPEHVLALLQQSPHPVKIYGMGERAALGPLTFQAIHEQRFVEDLAGCRGVVCAAGNQLLGECLYLGKPVLALPESQHHEQMINAHFLAQLGVGQSTTLEGFQLGDLESFLERQNDYRTELEHYAGRCDGTADALAVIQNRLARTRNVSEVYSESA